MTRADSRLFPAVAERSIAVALAAVALGFLAIAWVAIRDAGFAQPLFDQYRVYPVYLGLPFPQNAIQLENGHRPVFPALVRIVEVHAFAANQQLQYWLGIAAWALTVAGSALGVLRSDAWPRAARWAGAAACVIALAWLGPARMLLHGNESLHVYFVTLALLVAAAGVHRHVETGSWWPACGAALAGTIATFSFGAGVAVFGAALVLALVLRAPLRSHLLLGAAAVASVFVYTRLLPGSDGVRAQIALRPLDLAIDALALVAAPAAEAAWPNATGHAPLGPAVVLGAAIAATAIATLATLLRRPAALIEPPSRSALRRAPSGRPFGLMGPRSRFALTPAGRLGVVLASLGGAVVVLIAISRAGYFEAHPTQRFAERYLPWSMALWLGCVLLVAEVAHRRGSLGRIASGAFVAAVIGLGLAFLPSQLYRLGWAGVVSRLADTWAVACLLDVRDTELAVQVGEGIPDEQMFGTVQLFRERGLAMFAAPLRHGIGERVPSPSVGTHSLAAAASPQPALLRLGSRVAPSEGRPGYRRFEGTLVAPPSRAFDEVAVVDEENLIVGVARFTSRGASPLSWVPWQRSERWGFDGYVREPSAARDYRIIGIDAGGSPAVLGALVVPGIR